jgi:hypothetical protein
VKTAGEGFNDHSIYSADKGNHLKIVVVALVAGIVLAGVGLSSRADLDPMSSRTASIIKAGKPTVISSSNASVAR